MNRLPMLSLTVALAFFASFNSARSQPTGPFAEITVAPEEVPVGEPITLHVSVYVPTWFAKPPTFPSFEIPNAITRLPPDSSRPTSKRVGRDTWTGISRNYQVYPLLGARFRIENQPIELQYANPGSDPTLVTIDTGEVSFRAIVPTGAENLDPYVAGSALDISLDVEGGTDALAVGDAIVVTYTAELDGLSAIFLPDLVRPINLPGLSAYPEQPVVDDGAVARRTEKVTYIFNAGGEFEIPGVAIDWWNRDSEQIETASVPGLSLTIDGPPLQAEPADKPTAERNWWPGAAVLLLLILFQRRIRGRFQVMRARSRERKRIRRGSESVAWERTRKALHGHDPRFAHDEIVRWLGKLVPGVNTSDFAVRYGDAELAAELAKMNRSLYGASSESPDLRKIAHKLSAARKRCLAEIKDSTDVALPPLNP